MNMFDIEYDKIKLKLVLYTNQKYLKSFGFIWYSLYVVWAVVFVAWWAVM